MNVDTAYNKGMRDFQISPKEYKNPYSRGTIEFNEYEAGWVQALKREPRTIRDELYKRLGLRKTEKAAKIYRTTKELYERRKG